MAGPLSPQKIADIKARLARGDNQSQVARDTGVSRPKINALAKEVPKPEVSAITVVRNVQAEYAAEVRAHMPPPAETAAETASVWKKISDALPKAVDCLVNLLETAEADGVKVRAAAAIAQIAKDHAEKFEEAEADNVFEFVLAKRPMTTGAGDAASVSAA